MSIRLSSLQSLSKPHEDRRFVSNVKDKPVSQLYGENVFGEEAIKKYIMRDAYESLMESIKNGVRIDDKTADFVAVGMKNWAMDRGATHYTHWFQPMTGKTAEKHDAFFKLDKNGNAIESFDGKTLVKQEPDGSSFPNGGLRGTHFARAYTVWDPSSYAFLQETSHGKVLCIPAIFITYEAESMDLKTPLLKSINLIDKAATAVAQYFDPKVNKVTATLGWEQEYFVIDQGLFNARPDLMLCGRTLFGNASARGQQLDDHYFASIPERVHDFMIDFEDDCLMLGIPLTTRHNEVAPTQFECAPFFESVNIAADHNQLLMDIIDRIAKRHGLRALLHEKPYAGLNGSGKHNNWSLATDTGVNLLNPGDDAGKDLQFLTFFINTLKAIHDHAPLLRASIATAGNEHRLGANEAPPAIISVFTGDDLEEILSYFKDGKDIPESSEEVMAIDLEKIAHFAKDKTDRNRTSPFPFTGNRFEFRAVGSSVNVSNPMTVLNVMVADQLIKFKNNVDKLIQSGTEQEEAIKTVLRDELNECWKIIFNGDGYSDKWVEEAEGRGLPNVKSTPEALEAYISEESIDLFKRNKIFTENEVKARYNVMIEEYISKLEIESRLIEEISNSQIIPAVIEYQNKLIKNVRDLQGIGLHKEADDLKGLLTNVSEHMRGLIEGVNDLHKNRHDAENCDSEAETAKMFHNKVKPCFDEVRYHADKLELIVDDKLWPLPKYRELLFLH